MAVEQAYLDKAIERYSPEVAATARAALKKLRARFPGARQLVYDRRQSLPIGFAPAEQGSAVFSLVLYPRWVRFFFLEGVAIDDPEGRLEGSGNQVRSVRVDERATIFDDPYIRGLMAQALKVARADLQTGRSRVVLKSTIATPASGQSRNRPGNRRLAPAGRQSSGRRG
ncbi:MAG TPA: hypothetical protein VF456_25580 [Vicinamibacterales bacterium]